MILLKISKSTKRLESNIEITNNNLLNFRRLQNRESAIRSRQKKKEGVQTQNNELEDLKTINYNLLSENNKLKNDTNNLKDKIKFLQSIIQTKTEINTNNKGIYYTFN